MAAQFRLLTVCTGNVHRSPLAASLLRRWVQWYAEEGVSALISVQSAGIAPVVGAPMGEYTRQIAAALGADGSAHRAASLTDTMIDEADLVLTATVRQRDDVVARLPAALKRTFTIREAGRAAQAAEVPLSPRTADGLKEYVDALASHRSHGADDIVDPHGESEEVFLRMTAEEVPALAHLARRLFGMPAAEESAYVQAAEDATEIRSLIARTTGGREDSP